MTDAVWRQSEENVFTQGRLSVIFVLKIPSMAVFRPAPARWLPALPLLLLPQLALAGETQGRPAVDTTSSYLQRMDSNGDGRIDLDEYQAWMGYGFSRMDANGDGQLTADELPGGRGKPISQAEHLAQIAQRFARQDADGDGFLSARELAAPPR